MLTRLHIRNFKTFGEVDIELADRVVFVGPNNAGKTSALQALCLWHAGVRRWHEKRGASPVPDNRSGVTLNRRDLVTLPVPSANLLWRDLHVRRGVREDGKKKTKNVLVDIAVEGVEDGTTWSCALEFDYANEESFYCRTKVDDSGNRGAVPSHVVEKQVAFLPPMSGLAASELKLDPGAIDVRIGEGRTADVLRNLCFSVLEQSGDAWRDVKKTMAELFGVNLHDPIYVKERGEIAMTFATAGGVTLDISASGRGQQQSLLLLAHMAARPSSVLLLDEPDAHLEILRQRQTYQVLTQAATQANSQLIIASHSEVILNEAADRDVVIAFVGKPHRIDDRGAQVLKALKEIGFEQYLLAEQKGFVLYVEGSTDLAILQTFAEILEHPAIEVLRRPFVHYVGNQPNQAIAHFHGLREAKGELVGFALYDRLEREPPAQPVLVQRTWKKREIENYLCQPGVLDRYAERLGGEQGDLFAASYVKVMRAAIEKVAEAARTYKKPDIFGPDIKATDDMLDAVFEQFFSTLKLPNLMRKTDYHELARFLSKDEIDAEVSEVLDAIVEAARKANPAGPTP